MRKRRKALSMRIGVVTVENGAGQTQNQEKENNEEDEQVNREQTDDRVFLPNGDLYEESPLPHPAQEEAGDKSPEKKGVQETTSTLSGQNSIGKSMTGQFLFNFLLLRTNCKPPLCWLLVIHLITLTQW